MAADWQKIDRDMLADRVRGVLADGHWHTTGDVAMALGTTGSWSIVKEVVERLVAAGEVRAAVGWRNVFQANWTRARVYSTGQGPPPERPAAGVAPRSSRCDDRRLDRKRSGSDGSRAEFGDEDRDRPTGHHTSTDRSHR